jgi:hypothetical protein
VIRAIVHLANDQPLAVDIDEMPTAADISIVCRNVRTLDGKKPVFIDHTSSTFVFPYASIRFVEIPVGGGIGGDGEREAAPAAAAEPEDLEIDEDFLRRVREA